MLPRGNDGSSVRGKISSFMSVFEHWCEVLSDRGGDDTGTNVRVLAPDLQHPAPLSLTPPEIKNCMYRETNRFRIPNLKPAVTSFFLAL